jgi:hypothetical protein
MLIDNIFDYDTYEYVNNRLKKEWNIMYNKYDKKYYEKQQLLCKKNNKEKLISLNSMINLCKLNIKYVNNLLPKTNLNLEYTENVKRKLLISFEKIIKFCEIKIKLIYSKFNKSKNYNKNKIQDNIIKNNIIQNKPKYNKYYFIIIILFIIFIIF